MRKSKIMKMILVITLSLMLVFVATQVFAEDDGFTDLTGSISNSTSNTTDASANNAIDNTNTNSSLNDFGDF